MDKYEYRVKTEQMLEHMEHKRYKKAMEIADTIDWKRVKNPSILNSVSEIYEYNGEFQKSRDVLFMAYDRAPNSRKTVYRLGALALKINDIEEASDCYEEFVKLAPKDPNQYILKYKILKARRAPLAEQIDALEDFKKAEYIEKWAYELARLYDQAGMTAECLEECDDLILWFSEGKYVYQAMELKMKYKPLTPLQQERYESQKKGIGVSFGLTPEGPEEAADASPAASAEGESVEDIVARMMSSVGGRISDATNPDMKPVMAEADEEEEPAGAAKTDRTAPEEAAAEPEPKKSGTVNIRQTVKGATLAEALRNGFAVANGIDLEPKTKAIDKRDEDLRITGQMKIEEILMEWEAKQRENAKAIDSQRKRDEEARVKEKLEAEKRREEEARRIEKQQRAAEEARRHAEMRAAEEKRRLAARKAEEERILAEQKAEEERRQAILKAEEEERFLERLAAGKTAQNLDDDQTRQQEEETAAIDAALGEDEFEDESYEETVIDEFEDESYEEAEADEFEDESYEEAAADEFEDESYEEAEADKFEDESYEEAEDSYEDEDNDLEDFFADQEELQESTGMTEDLRRLMEELEAGEAESNGDEEETYEEAVEDEVKDDAYEDEAAEAEFEEASYEEMAAAEFEDESYEEAAEDKSEGASHMEEHGGEPEESYTETDEDDFEEDYVGNYDEETYDGDWDDFDEDDFEEETLADAIEEEAVLEEEIPAAEEPEPVKPVRKKKPIKLEEKPEEKLPTAPKAKKTLEKPEELTIEEPTEEEIQKRIKKGKGGMPFDTGFVVTGRYDLSATSEIGLRAGLTEEQKKLFSYFVPVRGMSEQIVEVLDNDRRERREGTSRTGNIIVMGQKGSGKTVLAVDIVKAIQKQRNLKQGKVAIVTGESLNKKELTSIIQKLRGGAIIIEKAGKLNTRTIKELNRLLEKKTGELLVVLEDQKKPLERIFTANPSFKKKFTSRLELPAFINDELVTFGQTYAKESGYKLDEMGILALYSRIDVMQREDHSVTVAEVKEIMDEAIEHSKKANVKHFARRVFGKGTDDSDRIILKEDDFRI